MFLAHGTAISLASQPDMAQATVIQVVQVSLAVHMATSLLSQLGPPQAMLTRLVPAVQMTLSASNSHLTMHLRLLDCHQIQVPCTTTLPSCLRPALSCSTVTATVVKANSADRQWPTYLIHVARGFCSDYTFSYLSYRLAHARSRSSLHGYQWASQRRRCLTGKLAALYKMMYHSFSW